MKATKGLRARQGSAVRINSGVRPGVRASKKPVRYQGVEECVAGRRIESPEALYLWVRETEARDFVKLATDDLHPLRDRSLDCAHLLFSLLGATEVTVD